MIQVDARELRHLSKERLQEARLLLAADKLDGAKYLAGYAIEHAIKYRICKHLKWPVYPPSDPKTVTPGSHWQVMERGLLTHDLEILLLFCGELDNIFSDSALAAAWDNVKDWRSELRYSRTAVKVKEKEVAKAMIDSVVVLMKYFKCPTT